MSSLGTVALSLCCLMAQANHHATPHPKRVGIFYLPFDRLTYAPIDEKGIESTFDLTSCVQAHVHDILAVLTAAPGYGGKFTHNVRLKVKLPDGSAICVDQSGAMERITPSGKLQDMHRRLTKDLRHKIEVLIREATPHA